MDVSLVEQIGLSRNEVAIYSFLAKRGRAPAQLLAREAKMPRSTVYSVLSSLENKGLVRREKFRGATLFRAEDPSSILSWLSEDAIKLQQRQAAAQIVVKELSRIFQNKPALAPKLEFFEGKKKVEKFLYENLLLWCESAQQIDSTCWGFQDPTFVENFQTWMAHAVKVLHVEGNVVGRLLTSQAEIENKLRGKIPRRHHRVWSDTFNFESSMWIMGNFVVLISTRNSPIYAFQLQDPLLAGNLRLLFGHLYQNAREMK